MYRTSVLEDRRSRLIRVLACDIRQAPHATTFLAYELTACLLMPAATPTACGSGLDRSDFTFRGAQADACGGPFISDPSTLSEFNTALSSVAAIGGDWNVLTTASADWNGFRFIFSSEAVIGPSPASGNFWLTVTDLSPGTVPEYPIRFDLLFAPKAGGQWASYLFSQEEFTLDDTGSGTWFIRFTDSNPGELADGLSQMNFLLRGFVGSECTQNCNTPTGETEPSLPVLTEAQCDRECPSVLSVPEPGSLALLGLGAVLLTASSRKKR